ncbi:PHP domain-containing protein, partial [Corynebacterium sanguinis]
MMFHGGEALSWSRLERILSGRPGPMPVPVNHTRPLVDAPTNRPEASHAPFAELHAVSSYSFLGGASEPEEMVRHAKRLGITTLALLDRDGFYGAVKFAEAAAREGVATVFGAELSLGDRVLPVLARGPEGYRRLSRLIAAARMITREKDEVAYPPLELIAHELAGTCIVLAGW